MVAGHQQEKQSPTSEAMPLTPKLLENQGYEERRRCRRQNVNASARSHTVNTRTPNESRSAYVPGTNRASVVSTDARIDVPRMANALKTEFAQPVQHRCDRGLIEICHSSLSFPETGSLRRNRTGFSRAADKSTQSTRVDGVAARRSRVRI